MLKYRPFEMHCHTRHSDGTFLVPQLIESVAAYGYAGLALTDHNAVTGLLEVTEELQRKTGAKVWLAPQDACGGELFPFTTPDNAYADGEEIRVDTDLAFRVIATPGHSAGSVCLLCGGLLFSGDTLFAGDVGRTDLPGGSWDTLRESLKKLCVAVTENVQVLPGHEEFSTMDRERANNRYLQF